MADGATLADPTRIDIRGSLKIGRDTFIDVNTVFEGDVVLEEVSLSAQIHLLRMLTFLLVLKFILILL